MLQNYLIGSLIAFLTYIYFFYLFLNDDDIKDRNYPLWQKIVLFIISSVIISGLSYIGFFLTYVAIVFNYSKKYD
jgi:hypothetical protein